MPKSRSGCNPDDSAANAGRRGTVAAEADEQHWLTVGVADWDGVADFNTGSNLSRIAANVTTGLDTALGRPLKNGQAVGISLIFELADEANDVTLKSVRKDQGRILVVVRVSADELMAPPKNARDWRILVTIASILVALQEDGAVDVPTFPRYRREG